MTNSSGNIKLCAGHIKISMDNKQLPFVTIVILFSKGRGTEKRQRMLTFFFESL